MNCSVRKLNRLGLKTRPFYQAYSAVDWATLNFTGHDVRTDFPTMSGAQRADVSGAIVGLP